MAVKAVVVGNVTATYKPGDNGSVYLLSVVTHGNFVESYSETYFSSLSELIDWLKNKY